MERSHEHPKFVVCTRNDGCDDLGRRKIYQLVRDEGAAAEGYLRIIDDSGEDYLYPGEYFVEIELPDTVETALRLAS